MALQISLIGFGIIMPKNMWKVNPRIAAIQSTHNTPQTRPSVVLVKKEKG